MWNLKHYFEFVCVKERTRKRSVAYFEKNTQIMISKYNNCFFLQLTRSKLAVLERKVQQRSSECVASLERDKEWDKRDTSSEEVLW